jgi:VWFA-related protein
MENPLRFPLTRRTYVPLLGALVAAFCAANLAQGQDAPTKTEAQAPASKSSATQTPANDTSEVSTRDTPPTFRVRVNLVLVRVVVRDSNGQIVPNLKKEDFLLSDNRKPQVISTFSTETPESHRVEPTTKPPQPDAEGNNSGDSAAAIAALPQRFVAVVFDDADMLIEDTVWVRNAATRLFKSLAPTDRVGIYSTSGQVTQEFTQERERLQESLLSVVPRPLTGPANGAHECPDISHYQADLIQNKHDPQALTVATDEALQCAFQGDPTMRAAAQNLAESVSQRALLGGDTQAEHVYRRMEDILRRLANMPGQRVMVFVSPGFLVTSMLTLESSSLVDRANRANVVINTIDARGLYTPDMGDISSPSHDSAQTAGIKSSYRVQAQMAQSDILAQLADGTGGTFFHDRNDIDEGLREAAAAPSMSYLLGFSPQNLKLNGAYHTLKVALTSKQKFSVQARHGYYAPRTIADPVEEAKEEIQEALFSQDEIHDLPVELQTQFFKKDQTEARLAVLTHVDVKGIRFRKAEGRNRDDLTVATAIFDENGNFVTGGEKIVEMKLLDTTFARLSRSGFTLKSSFDVKPGTYLVRLVVRDAEGAQMAARNGAVNIPF